MPYGPCKGFYVLDPKAKRVGGGRGNARKRTKQSLATPTAPASTATAAKVPNPSVIKDKVAADDDYYDDDSDLSGDDPFVDRVSGRVNFDLVRKALVSAKPVYTHRHSSSKKTGVPTVLASVKARLFHSMEEALNRKRRKYLRPEQRLKNITEREEGVVIQYLALGGFRSSCCDTSCPSQTGCNRSNLRRIGSSLHSGAGQQVFGWDKTHRADLMLHFADDGVSDNDGGHHQSQSSVLHFHNHHESGCHYIGHEPNCWRYSGSGWVENVKSKRADSFKRGLADALTSVRPNRVRFKYSVTTSCSLVHGSDRNKTVASTRLGSRQMYATALEACLLERETEFFYLPEQERKRPLSIDAEVVPGILSGAITGFVTIKGGRENPLADDDSEAAKRFGFCVQKYAPTANLVSNFTKSQIADYLGFDKLEEVDRFLSSQADRTINSGTFHTWETLTTSYLKWLMEARGFSGFKIRHLAIYKFSDDAKHFLEPILQKRHEAKLHGDTVSAECLKLIGNGSFGYNGLESTNYVTVRFMRQETFRKERSKGLACYRLKHVAMLGLIRHKIKGGKGLKKKRRGGGGGEGRQYLADEAAEGDTDDDNNEEEEADVDDDDDSRLARREWSSVLGLEPDLNDNDEEEEDTVGADDEESYDDAAVERQNKKAFGSRVGYSFLYAVDVGGDRKKIFNNISKAVAILGNSKRVFFAHVLAMLQCLDPRLAELCYIDTDSCIWSQTYQMLQDCLLPSKAEHWRRLNVLADETALQSCHGKMKLEGVYRAGLFKTSKIYRLYEEVGARTYTRCKGVSRHQADSLEDRHFDVDWNNSVVVHRTSLRPTKTGEIVMTTDARKMSVPFNLKRYVTEDGIHTLPFSQVAGVEPDDDNKDVVSSSSSDSDEEEQQVQESDQEEFGDVLWMDCDDRFVALPPPSSPPPSPPPLPSPLPSCSK